MNKKNLFLGLACLVYGQIAVGMQRNYKSAESELIKEISTTIDRFFKQEVTNDKTQNCMKSFYDKKLKSPNYTVLEWVNSSAISIVFDFLNDMNLENKNDSTGLFELLSNLIIKYYKKFEEIKEIHLKVNLGFWILMEIRGILAILKLVTQKRTQIILRLILPSTNLVSIDFDIVIAECIKNLKEKIAKGLSSSSEMSTILSAFDSPEQRTNNRVNFFATQKSTKKTTNESPPTNGGLNPPVDGCTIL